MARKLKYYNGSLVEYDILPLVDFYDPILRKPTTPFNFLDPHLVVKQSEYITFTIAETLSELGGLGLSANQIGLNWRVCGINVGTHIMVMFNPYIIEKSETLSTYSEGCLSYPGLYLKVPRSNHIKVKFQAVGGQLLEQEFDGLSAVCIQHELDHLDGIVYTELVSPIKLEQAKRKVKSNVKKMARARVPQETTA